MAKSKARKSNMEAEFNLIGTQLLANKVFSANTVNYWIEWLNVKAAPIIDNKPTYDQVKGWIADMEDSIAYGIEGDMPSDWFN